MGRTYDEILTELKQYAKQRWPDWNIDAKHIGNILLEGLSDQVEKMEYRVDNLFNELFPDTATNYSSVLHWARLVGYPVQSVIPAKTNIVASVPQPASTLINVPAGTRIVSPGQKQIVYETIAAAQIPEGSTSIIIPVLQVESKNDVFVGTGEAFQVYETEDGPVWTESIVVKVDGATWTKVDDFLLSKSFDQHYSIELQENGKVLIMFGNGMTGKAPASESEIDIIYKVSHGADGIVPANMLTVLDSVIYDANGWLVDLRVYNPDPAIDGQNQEDINHIKDHLPGWISSSDACVIREDFANAALAVPGVQRVLVMTREQDSSIPPLTYIIYVVPKNRGEPSQELLDQVLDAVTIVRPRILTLVVDVKAAKYQVVDISCTITPNPRVTDDERQALPANVEEIIRQFFDYNREEEDRTPAIDFGKPIYLAKFTGWITSIPSIANISFSKPSGDIIPAGDVIPALGSVVVNVT